MISSYQQISHVVTDQMVIRDKTYSAYLQRMRETLLRQHEELVKTQRMSGLPVRLPYCKKTFRDLLSPPKMLRKYPVGPVCDIVICTKYVLTLVSSIHARHGSRHL